jgi:hypothetical protein
MRRMTATNRHRRFLLGPAVVVVLAGCSSGGKVAATNTAPPTTPRTPAATSTTSTTSTTATTSTTTKTTTTVTAPATATTTTATSLPSGFTAAKQQWLEGATVDDADVGLYWRMAATDLNAAIAADPTGTSGYATAVQELTQMASLPDAMLTPAQQTEERNDTAALNAFFGTPGLYS